MNIIIIITKLYCGGLYHVSDKNILHAALEKQKNQESNHIKFNKIKH
jgi:hypothetical protein